MPIIHANMQVHTSTLYCIFHRTFATDTLKCEIELTCFDHITLRSLLDLKLKGASKRRNYQRNLKCTSYLTTRWIFVLKKQQYVCCQLCISIHRRGYLFLWPSLNLQTLMARKLFQPTILLKFWTLIAVVINREYVA